MSVLDNFDNWKQFLGSRLDSAQNNGLNDEVISDVAQQIGGYLAKQVEPQNAEEKVLAELWNVASEEEQQAIANMMVKLVDNKG